MGETSHTRYLASGSLPDDLPSKNNPGKQRINLKTRQMELLDIIWAMLVLLLTMLLSHRVGYLKGRSKADQMLGINRDEALRKIRDRATKAETE